MRVSLVDLTEYINLGILEIKERDRYIEITRQILSKLQTSFFLPARSYGMFTKSDPGPGKYQLAVRLRPRHHRDLR